MIIDDKNITNMNTTKMQNWNFNHLKRIVLLSFLLVFTTHCQKENQEITEEKEIEIRTQKEVALGTTPGIIVGTIKNGEIRTYAFGKANIAENTGIDSYTIFEIGSITKTFTALLAAQQTLNGNLDLQNPANMYLPSNLQLPARNGMNIRVQDLLNHTSGLPREPLDLDYTHPFEYTESQMSSYLNQTQLISDPGTSFLYSNTGMGLAGYLLALNQNTSYSGLVEQNIFDSLQMQHSYCLPEDQPQSNVAQGYMNRSPRDMLDMSDYFQGAGTIKSNMHDMLLYLNNLMSEESVLQEAFDLTLAPTFEAAETIELCLGWIKGKNQANQWIYFHDGGTMGFSSFIGFNREEKYGVVVLMNSYCFDGEQDAIGIDILEILGE